jgi:hypothetical protein
VDARYDEPIDEEIGRGEPLRSSRAVHAVHTEGALGDAEIMDDVRRVETIGRDAELRSKLAL